ncbi:MAG: dTDP-glucose 4,6-dehydratase [Pseudomonadota bacterium]|nr:dTDP-glucose 4,6-dehydratase [Pseudomonadota bacterium]
MRIIVTGGAGFIGSCFVRMAISSGHEVINVDALTYAACIENVESVANHKNYHFVQADIRNKLDIESVFNEFNPTHLINLAAESHVDRSIDSAEEILSTNIMGTFNLLEVFREYTNKSQLDCKFLHVSTDEVYGTVRNNHKFDENTKYDPANPYSASKAASDHLVRAWGNTYGLPIIITNCSNNYGPYQFPEKLIPVIILNCLNKKQIPIYGDGSQIRDWIYVDDHVSGLLLVLEKGVYGSTYNIGSSNEIKNIDLTKKVCNLVESIIKPDESYQKLIKFVDDRPGHDIHYAIDSNKIINELGWAPKYTLAKGLEKTVRWYLDNQDWLFALSNRSGVGERLGLSGVKKI